jgi:cytochrome c-type biogenesis protein CcmH/NrfG
MSVNARSVGSLISIAVLFVAMTSTGLPAIKIQKQGKETETDRLVREYAKDKRWQDLTELCQRYLRDKPSDAEMLSILGIAYSELGHHQESLDAFKRVVQLRPSNQSI